MSITSLDPKDVLIESFLEEYKKGMRFFYSELTSLNTNIYIINHIRYFPFDLFCHPNDTIFFSMVLGNFFDASVLIITRLATDRNKEFYTLKNFKSLVFQSVKQEYKESFAEHLRRVKFDAKIRYMLKKAKKLRNDRIAHSKKDSIFNIEHASRLDFSELENLRNTLNSNLDALAFNVEHLMLPIPYINKFKHQLGNDYESDIERILDSIVKDSSLLNLPENRPELWQHRRVLMTEEQIKLLNSYRKKFSLPEV